MTPKPQANFSGPAHLLEDNLKFAARMILDSQGTSVEQRGLIKGLSFASCHERQKRLRAFSEGGGGGGAARAISSWLAHLVEGLPIDAPATLASSTAIKWAAHLIHVNGKPLCMELPFTAQSCCCSCMQMHVCWATSGLWTRAQARAY